MNYIALPSLAISPHEVRYCLKKCSLHKHLNIDDALKLCFLVRECVSSTHIDKNHGEAHVMFSLFKG